MKGHKIFTLIMIGVWLTIGITCIVLKEFPFITSICLWILLLCNYVKDLLEDEYHDNN